MGAGEGGKKKGLTLLGRGRAALSPGSGPSSREPSPTPEIAAAAKQSPPAHGETRRSLQLPRFFSKFSRDRSKAPAGLETPRSDTGPPGTDTEPPKQVLTSKDIHAEIIQLVHQVLGPGVVVLDGPANVKNLVGDIQQDLQKRCTNGPSRKKMSRILKRVEYYFGIVNVAIQHQPQVTALVWAGVRTIVQISLNHLDTLENLEQAIESVPTTILMAEFYHSLYDAFVRKPPEVVRNTELLGSFIAILPGLYADVIVFMVKAKGYFEPSSMTSAIGKSLVPFCLKFKPLVDGINEKEAALRKLIGNATMAQILENSEDLQVLRSKLDEWGDCLRDNWKRLARIEDKLSRVIDDHEKERLIKCRMWLRPLQNPDDELNSNLSNKTEGTCIWIQNTEEFGLMIEEDEKNHLWIEGKPGAGKSVLLSYLVHTTRKNSTRKNPVLYFFCKDASSETSTAAAIVANLIDQLVTRTKLESLLDILSAGREEHANSTHCTDFAILWGLFLGMVHEFPTRITIFVDALDECSEKERSTFMGAVVSLPGNACLCVTSRGLPDIGRAFQDQQHQRKILRLEMQSQDDIIMFLNESIDKNQELHCHREKVLEKVAFNASGMFRYAALLVGELLHSPCQNIPAALESHPTDLYEMYETILLRLDTEPPRDKLRHRTQRKRILQWVTAARRPLKPSELAWSCAAVGGEESFDPESVDIRPQELMKLCSPLLEIVDGCVHFTHISAKEFLLQKPEDLYSWDSCRREKIAFYLVDNIGAHVAIATVGVALSRNVTGVKVKGCYPITHWPHHAQDVATSREMSQNIQVLWDRVSRLLGDKSMFFAWMLEFPWQEISWPSPPLWFCYTPGDFPHALHIASHYGLDEVLNQLLSTDSPTVKLENSLELKLFGGTPLLHAISGGFVRAVQRLLDFGVKIDTRYDRGYDRGTTPLETATSLGNEKITQLLLDRGAVAGTRDKSGRTPLSRAALGGRTDLVQLLLDRGAEIETRDVDEWTPLSHALWGGYIDVGRLLLDRGAEFETRDSIGRTPLSRAALGGRRDLVQLLLSRGAEIETRDVDGWTPLSHALWEGYIDVVRLLLDHGADVETRDNSGRTPLSNAADRGGIDTVQLLLDQGAGVETRDDDGCTPLLYAVLGGFIDVVRLLLDRGAEVQARDNSSRTPLSCAARGGRKDVMQLLLDHAAGVETRDSSGRTPLSHAAEGRAVGVVQLLLEYGAGIETRDNSGRTPLSHAARGERQDVMRLLLHRGAEIETRENNGRTPLSWAAEHGAIAIVELLLDHGAEIETQDNGGRTSLSHAARAGRKDVVQLLLNHGAVVEMQDGNGRTPLSHAAEGRAVGVVQLLLEYGAGIEARDNSGRTPLSYTAQGGREGVMQLLLDSGAEIETQENYGRTPLSWAAEHGAIAVVKLLLDRGAEIEVRDSSGRTPLSYTAQGRRQGVMQLLLDHGAEIKTRENSGRTPLSWAAGHGAIAAVKLLLDRGAEIQARDNSGRTPLSYAARGRGKGVVQLLLDRGAEVEARENSGQTPLSCAAEHGAIDVVELLLDHGAEVEAQDNSSRTPLSRAARGGRKNVTKLLLDHGAGVETRDGNGRTPLSWAAEHRGKAIVELLLDYGARIETRDNDGRTPLSHAARGGRKDVMRLLLHRGAEVETWDDSGRTPLSDVSRGGRKDATQLLLNYGVVIETRDDSGRTPLSHAAEGRAVDVVQLLLEYGANIETRDNRGRTPLSHAAEFAASQGYSVMVRFLLTWPTINVGSQDDGGLTAIGWAEAISEKHTGRDRIASKEIVAILSAALLQQSHNLFTDGSGGTVLPGNGGRSITW